MSGLERVMDAVEAVVDQHLAQRPEMKVDRRMDVVRQQPDDPADQERRRRPVDLDQAHRDRDEQAVEHHLKRGGDVRLVVRSSRGE